MVTNLIVKSTVRVNGREYASREEMPADIRRAYERAVVKTTEGTQDGLLSLIDGGVSSGASLPLDTRIVFNGQEYASVQEMPAAVRQLYESVVAVLEADKKASVAALSRPAHQEPQVVTSTPDSSALIGAPRAESTNLRLLIAGVVIAVLLLVSFVLGR